MSDQRKKQLENITQPSSDNLSLLQTSSFKISLEPNWRKLEFADPHYNNLRKTLIELMDAEEYPQSFGNNVTNRPPNASSSIPGSTSSVNIAKSQISTLPNTTSASVNGNAVADPAYKQPIGIMFPLIMPPELESLSMGFFGILNDTLADTLGSFDNAQRYNLSVVQIWVDWWQALLFPWIVVSFHGILLLKMKKPYPWLTIPLTAFLTIFLHVFCEANSFSLHVTLQGFISFFFLRAWDVTIIWNENLNDPDWLYLKNPQNRLFDRCKVYFTALVNIKPCGGWYRTWLTEQHQENDNRSKSLISGGWLVLWEIIAVLALVSYFFAFPFENDLPLILDLWRQPILSFKYCAFVFLIYLMIKLEIGGIHKLSRKIFPERVQLRPIFRSPWLATSVREFWGARWNLFYRDTFHRIIFIPVMSAIDQKPLSGLRRRKLDKNHQVQRQPRKKSQNQLENQIQQKQIITKDSNDIFSRPSFRKRLSVLIAGLSTFTYSALLHEYFIYTFFRTFTLEHALFFLFHGIILATETIIETFIIEPLFKGKPFESHISYHLFNGIRRIINLYIFVSIIPLFANPFIRFDIFDSESNKIFFNKFANSYLKRNN